MLRSWVEQVAKPATASLGTGAAISFVTHVALIGLAVMATARPEMLKGAENWIANRVYFIPPPDRVAAQPGSRETVRYVELAPEGPGSGLGLPAMDSKKAWRLADTKDLGDMGRDTTSSAEAPAIGGKDSVFTELEVDLAAVRDPSSAAPDYPIELLQQGIEGVVATRYVVDSTGYADAASLKILSSTHPQFTAAVRAALPHMRFAPAHIGAHAVRQLVEQEFSFKIQRPDSTKTVSAKP